LGSSTKFIQKQNMLHNFWLQLTSFLVNNYSFLRKKSSHMAQTMQAYTDQVIRLFRRSEDRLLPVPEPLAIMQSQMSRSHQNVLNQTK